MADPLSRFDAAICATVAGAMHGLTALAEGIADNPDAVTRFVLVSPPGRLNPPTGADKTTMVLFMRENHPGALLEILEQFVSRGVNLCRIESRPTKRSLGDYCFSVDAEGHVDDARLAEALMGLHRICGDVVFLGSYPGRTAPSRRCRWAPPTPTTRPRPPGCSGSRADRSAAPAASATAGATGPPEVGRQLRRPQNQTSGPAGGP